jgi:hypothetical protein
LTKYRVLDWDPQTVTANETVANEIEKILNENAANGWVFERSEDLENGQRRFYFTISDGVGVA